MTQCSKTNFMPTECKAPLLVPNLKLRTPGPITCYSTVEVECASGFRLIGASKAVCLPGLS